MIKLWTDPADTDGWCLQVQLGRRVFYAWPWGMTSCVEGEYKGRHVLRKRPKIRGKHRRTR